MPDIASTLTELERKVLRCLKDFSKVEDVMAKAGLQEIEVLRALQWLSAKSLVTVDEKEHELVQLDVNGQRYRQEGLPEKRCLKAIVAQPLTLDQIKDATGLDFNEVSVSLGQLKQKGAIDVKKEKETIASITPAGHELLGRESLEEKFLKGDFPRETSTLSPEEQHALNELRKRRQIIRLSVQKDRTATLTEEGIKVSSSDLDARYAEKLTPEMLKDGSWKGVAFRHFDVTAPVPRISGGKRHFVSQAISYAKRIWTDMGFVEMEGPILNTSFWNFDALFTAQDHPVRDMQDTFFIKNPEKGRIPQGIVSERVRQAHEEGIAGATGWRYKWDPEEAKMNVMRTHTTVLSARTLAALKDSQMPAKFFSVGKCFRNEAVDWKHHFEFNQTDGIVVDPNANFRHLLGYLKEFFRKMGYPEARFRPSHFPYTEPSVEIDVFHPVRKEWIELGGAGIFRTEVVVPLLGKDIPVLAWGPGFDRMLMDYYAITDLRTMYSNDVRQLREMKVWLK